MKPLNKILLICTALFPILSLAKITVQQPVVFSTQKGQPTAIFMYLHNHSNEEINLAIVQSSVKSRLELHGTQNGKMVEITGIPIPPQSTIQLKRGGLHIMVFDIEKNLAIGEHYPVQLFFDNGEVIEVNAEVISP